MCSASFSQYCWLWSECMRPLFVMRHKENREMQPSKELSMIMREVAKKNGVIQEQELHDMQETIDVVRNHENPLEKVLQMFIYHIEKSRV